MLLNANDVAIQNKHSSSNLNALMFISTEK